MKQFHELREHLLRAGVAPRHVRRYISELADHLADLTAEEERAGRGRAEAESAALARLGSTHHLAKAIIEQRQFQSWYSRAPWAMFGIAPILLGIAYFIACVYLWCGWQIFLPGTDTPFGVHRPQPLFSLANIYFQAGKLYYNTAPIFVGWAIGIVAIRQRSKDLWHLIALALISWMGATAQIHAGQTAVPGGLGHISMDFFTPSPSGQTFFGALLYALVIFAVAVMPYVIWRIRTVVAGYSAAH